MLNRIARAALVAGGTAAAYWAVNQFLALGRHQRATARKSETKAAVHDWENEGGATLVPSTPTKT